MYSKYLSIFTKKTLLFITFTFAICLYIIYYFYFYFLLIEMFRWYSIELELNWGTSLNSCQIRSIEHKKSTKR